MKRVIFISGLVIILLLASVLLFLLFASEEKKQDVFSAFNFGNTTDPSVIIDTIVDTITGEDEEEISALRQLSLRRVVGATELTPTASSTVRLVQYVEAGTGHVYNLDIDTGVESRVSNITIALANDAVVSTDGSVAAVTSGGSPEGRSLRLITLPGDGRELASNDLPERVRDYRLTNDRLLYTTLAGDVLTGRSYNLVDKKTKTLFTIPFKEATVRFTTSNSVYVYPKTADSLEGYLYEVNGGVMNRLPIAGYGLTALADTGSILYSLEKNGIYQSGIYDPSTKESKYIAFNIISEKCAFHTSGFSMVCGIDSNDQTGRSSWYQGLTMSNDDLWQIDTSSGELNLLISPLEAVGRPLDITNVSVSAEGARTYFINKADGTLWLFDSNRTNP